jgi:flagellar basal-body rod modification protein FlgD
VPDGAYRIAVETGSAGSAATSVPFSVIGTATGVSSTGSVTQLQLGQLSVGLSALQSLAGG